LKPQSQEGDGEDQDSEQSRFSSHWGWFATIHHLSKTSILSITGDKAITDLNFIFVLNYLAFEQDQNSMAQREQNRQLQSYKIK